MNIGTTLKAAELSGRQTLAEVRAVLRLLISRHRRLSTQHLPGSAAPTHFRVANQQVQAQQRGNEQLPAVVKTAAAPADVLQHPTPRGSQKLLGH